MGWDFCAARAEQPGAARESVELDGEEIIRHARPPVASPVMARLRCQDLAGAALRSVLPLGLKRKTTYL